MSDTNKPNRLSAKSRSRKPSWSDPKRRCFVTLVPSTSGDDERSVLQHGSFTHRARGTDNASIHFRCPECGAAMIAPAADFKVITVNENSVATSDRVTEKSYRCDGCDKFNAKLHVLALDWKAANGKK